jgi:Sulfotransferase family
MTGSTEAPGRPAVEQRVPDFFIVGHPKSGTTALYEMLRSHPGVYMPDLKEPWYLAEDMRARFQPARSGAVPKTLEDYVALFAEAPPDSLVGEASSSYLFSHRAAARIAELRPDARAIAILREPASFLRSLHGQMLRDHIETERSLDRALALEDERRAGRRLPRRSHLPQMLLYSDHVRYVEQLRRYRDALGDERLLVLIYDDFRADNAGTLEAVQRFLGLEPAELELREANRSERSMRSQRLDDLTQSVALGRTPGSRLLKGALKSVLPARLRHRTMRATRQKLVYGNPPAPDAQLTERLREHFRPEVAALSEYLDRDLLSLWRYSP